MSLAIWHEFRHDVRCVFTVPFGYSYRIVRTKWVSQTKRLFNDKTGKEKHSYNVDLEKAHYSKKNNPILTYTIGKTDPMDFSGKSGRGESSNLYNTILMDKSGEEALNQNRNQSMLIVIIGLVLIIVLIGGFAMWQLGQANDKIILLSREMAAIIANTTKTDGVVVIR